MNCDQKCRSFKALAVFLTSGPGILPLGPFYLKWLRLLKFFFCRVSPISARLFCYIACTCKRSSLRLFRFKFHNVTPFWFKIRKSIENIKKGTNCEILNLNNRRIGRLKVHFTKQKSFVLMGETLQFVLSNQSLSKNWHTKFYK